MAAALGFEVCRSVSKKCNILVTGELDDSKFAVGAKTTSKYTAAEKKIANGEDVRIIGPTDFESLFS